MKLLHISDSSGYSNDVIRKNFDALIRYNNIWHTGILNFPDFPMSESGRIHFEEVKKVFSIFEYGALILIPLSAAEIIAAKNVLEVFLQQRELLVLVYRQHLVF